MKLSIARSIADGAVAPSAVPGGADAWVATEKDGKKQLVNDLYTGSKSMSVAKGFELGIRPTNRLFEL